MILPPPNCLNNTPPPCLTLHGGSTKWILITQCRIHRSIIQSHATLRQPLIAPRSISTHLLSTSLAIPPPKQRRLRPRASPPTFKALPLRARRLDALTSSPPRHSQDPTPSGKVSRATCPRPHLRRGPAIKYRRANSVQCNNATLYADAARGLPRGIGQLRRPIPRRGSGECGVFAGGAA